MLIIGLTGGIGSGKTTVTNFFKQLGVPIIDADAIAQDIVQPQTSFYKDIVEHFKEGVVKDKQLDRNKLREIIFANPAERQWLEALLHPAIKQEILHRISKIDAPYCIVVIPLLIRKKDFDYLDRVLVIDAPKALQIKRTRTRDQISEEAVKKIMAIQISREERLKLADDVIKNEGDMRQLEKQVKLFHEKYLKLK